MALSNAQLLMLDNLIYFDGCQDDCTVEEIINRIEKKWENDETFTGSLMDHTETGSFIAMVKKDKTLMNYTVKNYHQDSTGMRAACFVDDQDNPTDVNVVFRGTVESYEWGDNAKGAFLSDTEIQKKAANYIKTVSKSYGDYLTVTGHSKGGNLAQYVAIFTDSIARCVSFDGQGFSREFIEKYKDEIKKRANSIVSISASGDYVNCLLYPIAGSRIYIENEPQKDFIKNHSPFILLDENGNLRREGKQSDLSKLINDYTTYLLSSLDGPERAIAYQGLIKILESGDPPKTIWEDLYVGFIALSHIDDFSFNYIGETYGFPAELCASFVAAVACPYLFMDDLANCGFEMVDGILNGMRSLANVINERLNAFGEKAKEFGKNFVNGIASFASGVKESYNMLFNRGYR